MCQVCTASADRLEVCCSAKDCKGMIVRYEGFRAVAMWSWFVKGYLATVFLSALTGCAQDSCPLKCSCTHNSVTCNLAELTIFPTGLPNDTKKVSLKGNSIARIRKRDLDGLPFLEELELINCNIEEIENGAFDNLFHVKVINLFRNRLHTLKSFTFYNLPNLVKININRNMLIVVEERALSGLSLQQLHMDYNLRLWNITIGAFTNSTIRELSLSNCNISDESLESLRPLVSSLEILTLSSNVRDLNIPETTFRGFSFESLNLNDNGILNTDFLTYVNAKVLSLSNNPIGTFPFFLYPLLKNTIHLRLDQTNFNDFSSYNIEALGLPKLASLDMSSNGIRTISRDMEEFVFQLTSLKLTGNPLHCNCRTLWLKRYIQANPDKIVDAHCATPAEGPITEVDDDLFECIPPFNISAPQSLSVALHRPMALSCSAAGDPAPTITWVLISGGSMEMGPTSQDAPGYNKGYIYINNMTDVMYGIYECIAINAAGRYSVFTNVTRRDSVPTPAEQRTAYPPSSTRTIFQTQTALSSSKTMFSLTSTIRTTIIPTDAEPAQAGDKTATKLPHKSPRQYKTSTETGGPPNKASPHRFNFSMLTLSLITILLSYRYNCHTVTASFVNDNFSQR